MNYKYKVFCPYFGCLPSNFNLWLVSCANNTSFQFIVLTDDQYEDYCIPENVLMIKMNFDDFRKKAQKKFSFPLSLEIPYKLCDYKPVYGYILEEYLEGCQYWGYCDMDLVFGDLEKYMPDEEYDKISHLGHLCLYKNNKTMRECFLLKGDSLINYQDILSNAMHFGFDEIGDYGINKLLCNNGFSIYDYESNVADISCARDGMVLAIYKDDKFTPLWGSRIFAYEEGKIYAYELVNQKIEKKEYAYVHLQKRKIINNVDKGSKKFLILPHEYAKYQEVTVELIEKNQDKHLIPMKMLRIKYNSMLKRRKRKKVINELLKNK